MSSNGQTGSSQGSKGWLRRIAESISGEPRDLDQLADVLADARERGLIDSDVLEMLESVLDMSEIQVRDVMVPRSQMVVVNRDDSVEDILPVVIESGHSRFPVVGEDRDDVAGILLAKDLLRFFVEDDKDHFDIRECLRPAVFIPESKRLNVLLKEFRLTHNHMAIVVDEYGGVSGLLTIEDVLEQIVGDIGDEYDVDEGEGIRKEGDRTWTVPALTKIEEFNEAFGTRFSDEEADTIGGLVLHELGRMPRRGEAVQIGGLELKVTRADRRRIETLRVTTPEVRPTAVPSPGAVAKSPSPASASTPSSTSTSPPRRSSRASGSRGG
jgi:magnesium and cobalt transporter